MPDSNTLLINTLIDKIQKAGGSIPFSDYMEQVLYTPKLGYYMSNPTIFGATEQTGDFTTAPEISPLFGQTLAIACHKILKEIPNAIILELGAGSGKLAVDVLKKLEELGTPPKEYWILDPSLMLQAKQKNTLSTQLPHWKDKLRWLEKLPEKPFCGIVIANEVLDAMPMQRFQITDDGSFETHVSYHNGQFQDEYKITHNPEIQKLAEYILEEDEAMNKSEHSLAVEEKTSIPSTPFSSKRKYSYQSERLPTLKSFFQDLFASLEQGAAFFIDYGFPRHEFYHPDRHMGTLMCHYRQKTHPDPYVHIGCQDITAHIDFTDVAEKAMDAGFEVAGYTQQAAFLMNAGLLSLINHDDEQFAMQTKKAINLLTSPSEMGELFKVMALTKNIALYPFPGFEHFDKRQSL